MSESIRYSVRAQDCAWLPSHQNKSGDGKPTPVTKWSLHVKILAPFSFWLSATVIAWLTSRKLNNPRQCPIPKTHIPIDAELHIAFDCATNCLLKLNTGQALEFLRFWYLLPVRCVGVKMDTCCMSKLGTDPCLVRIVQTALLNGLTSKLCHR